MGSYRGKGSSDHGNSNWGLTDFTPVPTTDIRRESQRPLIRIEHYKVDYRLELHDPGKSFFTTVARPGLLLTTH